LPVLEFGPTRGEPEEEKEEEEGRGRVLQCSLPAVPVMGQMGNHGFQGNHYFYYHRLQILNRHRFETLPVQVLRINEVN